MRGEHSMPDIQLKRLIMPVHVQDDYFDDYDCAVAELNQASIDRIRSLSEFVKIARQADDTIYKIVAWDWCGLKVFKSSYSDEPDEEELQLKEPEEYRIDCLCLNVSDDGFYWTFYPKHTSIYCETAAIAVALLDCFDEVDAREDSDAE